MGSCLRAGGGGRQRRGGSEAMSCKRALRFVFAEAPISNNKGSLGGCGF